MDGLHPTPNYLIYLISHAHMITISHRKSQESRVLPLWLNVIHTLRHERTWPPQTPVNKLKSTSVRQQGSVNPPTAPLSGGFGVAEDVEAS